MKSSEILRLAADEHLSPRDGYNIHGDKNTWTYSCNAVIEAYSSFDPQILKDFGVVTQIRNEFDEFPAGPIRQCARFLWLHFAALVLEDEVD